MSTRAVYSFFQSFESGDGEYHHVYKHMDGYPQCAIEFIANALTHAWPLPRYEADDFAAAFVAANKRGYHAYYSEFGGELIKREPGGDIRLTHGWQDHGDLDFRYEIAWEAVVGRLIIKIYKCNGRTTKGKQSWKLVDVGSLQSMFQHYVTKKLPIPKEE